MADFYVKLPANSSSVFGDVNVISSTLPTGASTSAKQDTQITALNTLNTTTSAINTKITTTNVAGLDSVNVKVTDITLDASGDSVESRSMAMATRLDEVSSTVTYVGEAVVGTADSSALWRIKRIQTTGTVLKIEWANGNSNFSNIWNNRASLTYT